MSKITAKHIANVDKNGEMIIFADVVKWKQNKLTLKGQQVEITIKKLVKHRSTNQNAYFACVICVMFAEEMGCRSEEAKEALKREFLEIQLACGLKTTKPTSSLSTVEFEDFTRQCRQLAGEMFDLYIPLPNEINF